MTLRGRIRCRRLGRPGLKGTKPRRRQRRCARNRVRRPGGWSMGATPPSRVRRRRLRPATPPPDGTGPVPSSGPAPPESGRPDGDPSAPPLLRSSVSSVLVGSVVVTEADNTPPPGRCAGSGTGTEPRVPEGFAGFTGSLLMWLSSRWCRAPSSRPTWWSRLTEPFPATTSRALPGPLWWSWPEPDRPVTDPVGRR